MACHVFLGLCCGGAGEELINDYIAADFVGLVGFLDLLCLGVKILTVEESEVLSSLSPPPNSSRQ